MRAYSEGRLASEAERRSRLSMLAISWCWACKSEAPVAERRPSLMPRACLSSVEYLPKEGSRQA